RVQANFVRFDTNSRNFGLFRIFSALMRFCAVVLILTLHYSAAPSLGKGLRLLFAFPVLAPVGVSSVRSHAGP
ncbi:MAG: hypothetical protein RL186_1764, partial [Pseudomonadota bacterium]